MRTLLVLGMLVLGTLGSSTAQRPQDIPAGVPAPTAQRVQEPPADVPTYVIPRKTGPIVIDGRTDDEAWAAAEPIEFTFPWHDVTLEEPQSTMARLLYDDEALYVVFECVDPYLDSRVTERDGPVYEEDSIGIFLAPNPHDTSVYFGFEMNILGTLRDYVAYDGGETRTPAGSIRHEWRSEGVEIATTYEGTLNDHSDIDAGWVLEARIPFDNFRHYGARVPPQPNDLWHINLTRNAGYKRQFSLWADTRAEEPSFHHSAWFGRAFYSFRTP